MKNVTAKAILRLQWKSRNERNGLTRKKFEPVLPNFQFGRPEYQHLQCGLPFDEARVPSYSTPADRTVIRPISPSETSEIPKKKMDFAGFWQIKSSFDNRVKKTIEKLFSPEYFRNGKKFVLLQHQNPPSLSTMLKCAGRFIFIPMANRVPFHKPYTNPHDLVYLLQSRGLAIDDPTKAERYLEYIGYYRLSAYMYPLLQMPKEQHQYKQGATFNQVMTLYRFDKKLRLFIFNEIEKIEVAVRSAIVNTGSELTGNPFWMTDGANFTNRSKFAHTMTLIDAEINRSREDFIVHFKQSYSDAYPPAWILAEVLPFGVMTNIYNNIKVPRIKKSISQKFGLQVAPFESWLTIVTLTRNSCCHHARVWNKQNTIRPMLPNHLNGAWLTLPTDSLRIYFDLCIIKYFLDVISPQNDMRDKLLRLLSDYPSIDVNAMGFPKGWQQEPLWQ